MAFRLRWPTEFGVITQRFRERPGVYAAYGLPGHEGLDFRAPTGTKVFACADGVVTRVDIDPAHSHDAKNFPYGFQVRIQHADGYLTVYAHLQQVNVVVGQQVQAGDIIALANATGNTGNPPAAHLHLSLKLAGATAAHLTDFPNDLIDPEPFLDPFQPGQGGQPIQPGTTIIPIRRGQPDHPLRGLHDDGAADWLLNNNVQSWAVEVIYSNGDLNIPRPVDYSRHAAAGIRVIVRWNYSFAKADGGLGTYPERDLYDEFVHWCITSIRASKGVWGHIIGNEPNRAGERPDYQGPANPGTPITPSDITYIYNAVWNSLPTEVRASPPAIDPTNIETMDPLEYWRAIVNDLKGAEFFALHAYSYGMQQPVDSNEHFQPPLAWQYHSFRMWEPLAQVLNANPRFAKTPLIITETNHLQLNNGQFGWEPNADTWIQNMYNYVRSWNAQPGDQYVHGVCLYRLDGDNWRISDKPNLLQALRNNGTQPL